MKNNVFKNFIAYPIYFLIFCALNSVYGGAPFACGGFIGLLFTGAPLLITAVTFILSFLVYKSWFYMIFGTVFGVFFSLVFFLYRRKKKQIGAEIILYVFLGLIPYILKDFPDTAVEKLVYMSVIALFSVVAQVALNALLRKKLSRNITSYEGLSVIAFFVFTSVGFINLFSVDIYRPFAVVVFVLLSRYYKNNASLIVGTACALPLVIVTGNYEYLAGFLLFGGVYALLKNSPSIAISVGLCLAELVCGLYLGFYGDYGYINAVPVLFGLFLTSLISKSRMESISKKYNFDPTTALIRSVINRNRLDTSARLYDISNVFFQMQEAFSNLKKCTESTDVLVEKMVDEALYNMCSGCQLEQRCVKRNAPKYDLMEKIIRIGIAKGRVTIVDLPRDFTDVCGYPNSAIFEVNRLIGSYCEYVKNAESGDKSKEILSLQSSGVAGVLKGLAFSLSKTSAENKAEEKRIVKALSKKGVKCEGALCFGEGKDTEIEVIFPSEYFAESDVGGILSEAFSTRLSVTRAEAVANGVTAVTLKFAPTLDAVFGIGKITKTNSPASGDCHSLVKIDESNFLIALSDGMGSGEVAQKTSETALNLIESLYKAGLDSEFILTLVNKLLSISIDDNFSAIDIALVNLREGNTAFIKIGSPYGFILSESGIRFIEGSSLPLGILEELHPTTASAPLVAGDVIMMVSDGVTDAFSSSGDLVDFLKSAPLHNPQELADSVVNKALELSNGKAQDDMTAVCVRLIDAA